MTKLKIMILGKRTLCGITFLLAAALTQWPSWQLSGAIVCLAFAVVLLNSMIEDHIRKQYIDNGEIDPRDEDQGPPSTNPPQTV